MLLSYLPENKVADNIHPQLLQYILKNYKSILLQHGSYIFKTYSTTNHCK
ncbi:hypothetical protein PLIP_a0465 [Pseudoalteromonas lipolytica LMEB 39]|nr:hypothetical protein [Pseudoalteromonas lipolytica LMEB 39]